MLIRVVAVALALAAVQACATTEPTRESIDTSDGVVLLHGLARGAGSMKKIARELDARGFTVCNLKYPSRKKPPSELLKAVEELLADCFEAPPLRVHFVTHSLGGIMIRALVQENRPPNLGRVVMLAPPNHGSELVDAYGNARWFKKIMGPTAVELGTDAASLPNRLGPADFEVGIIAGSKPVHPLGVWILDEPSDGTVTITSAKLEGMRDLVVVRRSHSFLMNAPEVVLQASHFLVHGCFDRAAARSTFTDDELPCSNRPVALTD